MLLDWLLEIATVKDRCWMLLRVGIVLEIDKRTRDSSREHDALLREKNQLRNKLEKQRQSVEPTLYKDGTPSEL